MESGTINKLANEILNSCLYYLIVKINQLFH